MMMLKRIWTIFIRDVKINFREAMPLFIIVAPLLLAIGINHDFAECQRYDRQPCNGQG